MNQNDQWLGQPGRAQRAELCMLKTTKAETAGIDHWDAVDGCTLRVDSPFSSIITTQ